MDQDQVDRVIQRIAGRHTAPPRVELRPNIRRFLTPQEARELVGVWLQVSVMKEDRNAL